jgi:hypothetical protein
MLNIALFDVMRQIQAGLVQASSARYGEETNESARRSASRLSLSLQTGICVMFEGCAREEAESRKLACRKGQAFQQQAERGYRR